MNSKLSYKYKREMIMTSSEIISKLQDEILSKIDVKKVDDLYKTFYTSDANKASQMIRSVAVDVVNNYLNHISKVDLKKLESTIKLFEMESTLNALKPLRDEPGSLYTMYAVRLVVLNLIEEKYDNCFGNDISL